MSDSLIWENHLEETRSLISTCTVLVHQKLEVREYEYDLL